MQVATQLGQPAVRERGRDRQRERTRRRVRDQALRVFRRDGLAAARIDDIVRGARVSRGTFYFHFPTKEDVIVEILQEAEHRIAAAIAALPKSTPVRRVLQVACAKIAEEWEDEPHLFPDVGGVAVRRAAAQFRDQSSDPVSAELTTVFRAAVKRKELSAHLPAEVLADFFLVNTFAAVLAWCAHPKMALTQVLASVIEIFLKGARARR
jgi:AcrR family transcriptional regulator